MIAYYYWKEPFSCSLAPISKQTLYFILWCSRLKQNSNCDNTEFIMEHNYERDTMHEYIEFNMYKFDAFQSGAHSRAA